MKIGEAIAAQQATAKTRADSTAAMLVASQKLATDAAADDAAAQVTARGLQRIGPTLVAGPPAASWDSPDGLVIHVTPLNAADTDIPDDAPPVNPPGPA